MANGTLQTVGQGLRSFITGTPLSQIQSQDRSRMVQEEMSQLDLLQQQMNLDDARTNAMFKDALTARSFLDISPARASEFLNQRAGMVQQLGGNPSDTLEVLGLIQSGDTDGAKSLLDSVVKAGQQVGVLPMPEARSDTTANIKDFLYWEELQKQGMTDKAEAFANKAGLSKLDPEKQAQLQVETQRLKDSQKEQVKRLSGFANEGIGAADGVGTMRRALSLLDTVKTGGFNNLALRAKQLFGVEGADEGELSNNLGKAVLSQLRATFGAAFTAKEGEQLQQIEAGFGKSAATNKRLLQNALKVSERAARRGIKAAKRLGDDFTADEIQLALDGALNENFDFSAQVQPVTPAPTGFKIISIGDN